MEYNDTIRRKRHERIIRYREVSDAAETKQVLLIANMLENTHRKWVVHTDLCQQYNDTCQRGGGISPDLIMKVFDSIPLDSIGLDFGLSGLLEQLFVVLSPALITGADVGAAIGTAGASATTGIPGMVASSAVQTLRFMNLAKSAQEAQNIFNTIPLMVYDPKKTREEQPAAIIVIDKSRPLGFRPYHTLEKGIESFERDTDHATNILSQDPGFKEGTEKVVEKLVATIEKFVKNLVGNLAQSFETVSPNTFGVIGLIVEIGLKAFLHYGYDLFIGFLHLLDHLKVSKYFNYITDEISLFNLIDNALDTIRGIFWNKDQLKQKLSELISGDTITELLAKLVGKFISGSENQTLQVALKSVSGVIATGVDTYLAPIKEVIKQGPALDRFADIIMRLINYIQKNLSNIVKGFNDVLGLFILFMKIIKRDGRLNPEKDINKIINTNDVNEVLNMASKFTPQRGGDYLNSEIEHHMRQLDLLLQAKTKSSIDLAFLKILDQQNISSQGRHPELSEKEVVVHTENRCEK
jgi:hypothetical protein